jgi:hypothetical protein
MSWNKNEPSEFIGASAKLDAAARMRQAARADEDTVHPGQASQMIPITIVFVFAAGLAMMMPEGFLSKFFGGAPTGIGILDQALTGAAAPKISGDADLGRLVSILVRGLVLFLAAGAAPFLASVTVRAVGKSRVNHFVACWGMLIALPLFYLLWGSF